jgi:hypothetical protein
MYSSLVFVCCLVRTAMSLLMQEGHGEISVSSDKDILLVVPLLLASSTLIELDIFRDL